jgi:uncharacterized repeat protein (TIGR04076 family)
VNIEKAENSSNGDVESCQACEIERDIDESNSIINVIGMKRSCQYHRRARSYRKAEIVPENMCKFAYHALYPTILAMLYNGKTGERVTLPCPGLDNNMLFSIERTPKFGHGFLVLAEKLLRSLKIPRDIIPMNVSISVIRETGNCLEKMKVGDCFSFGNKKLFCASSFDGLIGILARDVSKQAGCDHVFQCTSTACRIQYKIEPDG